jgi:hypothetical protein
VDTLLQAQRRLLLQKIGMGIGILVSIIVSGITEGPILGPFSFVD